MIPSISLGTDSLGLGAFGASSSVQGCGNRPLFGKESKRAFEECVQRQQEINKVQSSTISNQPPANNYTFIIIAIVVVVVLILLLKRK